MKPVREKVARTGLVPLCFVARIDVQINNSLSVESKQASIWWQLKMAYCRNGTTDNRECVQYEDGMFDDHTPPTAPALTITNVARTKREAARPTPSPLSPKHIRLTINNQDYVGPTTSINNVKGELNDMKFSRIVSTIADNTSVSNATRAPFAARNTGICSDDSDNDQPALIQCKPTTKYTKHGLIGQGSYGSVQVGKNHENGQIVAIKTMNCKTDPRISYVSSFCSISDFSLQC